MEIKIKPAKQSNNKDILKIFTLLEIENYFHTNIKKINKHIQKKECFIALRGNQIIGAMILKFIDHSCWIQLIASKKKGGGKAMIEFAAKKCRQKKVLKLWCWSLKRYKTKGFYKKMGFTESYILKKQWFGEDCYFFGRLIKI